MRALPGSVAEELEVHWRFWRSAFSRTCLAITPLSQDLVRQRLGQLRAPPSFLEESYQGSRTLAGEVLVPTHEKDVSEPTHNLVSRALSSVRKISAWSRQRNPPHQFQHSSQPCSIEGLFQKRWCVYCFVCSGGWCDTHEQHGLCRQAIKLHLSNWMRCRSCVFAC